MAVFVSVANKPIMLSVIMPNTIMLSVIMVIVVAPRNTAVEHSTREY